MQPASTQAQGHTQDHLTHTYHGYAHRSSPVRAPHSTPFGFTQWGTPRYDSQPGTGTFRDTISMPPVGGTNDTYWGNSMNSFGRTSADPLQTGGPPPWRNGEYVPPYPPYGQFGQGGVNNTRFPVVAEPAYNNPGFSGVAEPAPNNAMNFSHPFPRTGAPPSSQGAVPVWQLSHCWVSHEAQEELHLTIVFKKFPSGEFMAP